MKLMYALLRKQRTHNLRYIVRSLLMKLAPGIPQIMPLDDETPVYSFNHAHTTLLLGCTDFTQGFRHSNLDYNSSPG